MPVSFAKRIMEMKLNVLYEILKKSLKQNTVSPQTEGPSSYTLEQE